MRAKGAAQHLSEGICHHIFEKQTIGFAISNKARRDDAGVAVPYAVIWRWRRRLEARAWNVIQLPNFSLGRADDRELAKLVDQRRLSARGEIAHERIRDHCRALEVEYR